MNMEQLSDSNWVEPSKHEAILLSVSDSHQSRAEYVSGTINKLVIYRLVETDVVM